MNLRVNKAAGGSNAQKTVKLSMYPAVILPYSPMVILAIMEFEQAIANIGAMELEDLASWTEKGEEFLKFSELLPSDLLARAIIARLADFQGAQTILASPISFR